MNTLEELEESPATGAAPSRISPEAIDRSLAATASSAHSRINVPLNLANWRDVAPELQPDLLWFHQHLLDNEMSLDDAAKAVGYDRQNVYQILKGIYAGSYEKVCGAIRSYRKISEQRGKIQNAEFAHNRNTRLIFNALDYTIASNTICLITGETGLSKTISVEAWRAANNHGRTVLMSAAEICPVRGSIQALAAQIGVNKNGSILYMRDACHRAFNKNRTLIVDEAQNLLPQDRRSNPAALEFFRRLHDATKCGLAFVASVRFGQEMAQMRFHFEQVLGRIGLKVRLHPELAEADLEPILSQYFARVTSQVMETSLLIANDKDAEFRGRLRALVEILRLTSRIASKDGGRPVESHFLKALALRKQLQGHSVGQ
jgi:DNA transposition AAA+ family ATPase